MELVKDTRSELTRLAEFIGMPAEHERLDKACNLANPGRMGAAAAQLDRDKFAALQAICARSLRNKLPEGANHPDFCYEETLDGR